MTPRPNRDKDMLVKAYKTEYRWCLGRILLSEYVAEDKDSRSGLPDPFKQGSFKHSIPIFVGV
jgi:hypothetical protein